MDGTSICAADIAEEWDLEKVFSKHNANSKGHYRYVTKILRLIRMMSGHGCIKGML